MENQQSQTFEQMLESSFQKLDAAYGAGDSVEGTIVSYDDEYAYVDIGAKQEAIADVREFPVEMLSSRASIQAYIDSYEGSRIRLTVSPGKGFTSPALLAFCFSSQIPVYGRITAEKQAGYDVMLGEIRAFCPKSQIGKGVAGDSAESGNDFIPFLLLEASRKNCIVSHRALKEKETAKLAETLRGELSEGDISSGTVLRAEKFGVFVRLENGLEGLVPRSELGLSRRVVPESFSPGDEVHVAIISLDWENNKHAFSIKRTAEDPWNHIDAYENGYSSRGTVTGMIRDGAFVEIEPGLEGFIHVSCMSKTRRVNKAEEVLSIGQEVAYTVQSIDRSRKRISLELVTDEADPWQDSRSAAGTIHQATVEKQTGSGLIIRLDTGLDAFVPARELTGEVSSYSAGSQLKIVLTEIDKQNRRASASEKQSFDYEEQNNVQSFINSQAGSTDTASLGAMFGSVLARVKEQVKDNDKA